MILSRRCTNYFDNHISEHISFVIRQCVLCHCPASFRGVSKFDTHNIYVFEFNEIPNWTFLNLLSNYFDAMFIDVKKEHVIIKLTIDFNKGIPF